MQTPALEGIGWPPLAPNSGCFLPLMPSEVQRFGVHPLGLGLPGRALCHFPPITATNCYHLATRGHWNNGWIWTGIRLVLSPGWRIIHSMRCPSQYPWYPLSKRFNWRFFSMDRWSDWWFQTWILCSTIYGMSSFPLANSYFSRWLLHHQAVMLFHFKFQWGDCSAIYTRARCSGSSCTPWLSRFPRRFEEPLDWMDPTPGLWKTHHFPWKMIEGCIYSGQSDKINMVENISTG